MRTFLLPLVFVMLACAGDSGGGPLPEPADTATLAPAGFFAELSAGFYHTCGRTPPGAVYCWGSGRGTFGNPDPATDIAVRPHRIGDVQLDTISAGGDATCGISQGLVLCWGLNEWGQLGTPESLPRCGTIPCSRTPIVVEVDASTFTHISAGGGHTCAVTEAAAAFCWGYSAYGRLGFFQTQHQFTPRQIETELRFRSVVAGGSQTCGVTADDAAYCWGFGEGGQLGNGFNTTSQATPAAVVGNHRFSQIALGAGHSCGLTVEGAIYCWGVNPTGGLGNGSATNSSVPVRAGTMTFTSVTAGGSHTCGIGLDERAYCWGGNGSGQLGDGTQTNRLVPTAVAGGLRFRQVTAGNEFTCGMTTENVAYCWGLNYFKGLGVGSEEVHLPSPRRVLAPIS
jgi:alpha-tubulin suppressor-like RCC1 family protein